MYTDPYSPKQPPTLKRDVFRVIFSFSLFFGALFSWMGGWLNGISRDEAFSFILRFLLLYSKTFFIPSDIYMIYESMVGANAEHFNFGQCDVNPIIRHVN